jgi:hypothetical protein
MAENRVDSVRDPRGLAAFLFERVDARLRDMAQAQKTPEKQAISIKKDTFS